eukprot:11001565-Heterocapsa_arctica.AAC.1
MVTINTGDEPDEIDEMDEGLSLYTVDDPVIIRVNHATLDDDAKGCLLIDTGAADNVSGSEWQERFAQDVLEPKGIVGELVPTNRKLQGIDGKPTASCGVSTVPVQIPGGGRILEGEYKSYIMPG